jgi:hypothetical protein
VHPPVRQPRGRSAHSDIHCTELADAFWASVVARWRRQDLQVAVAPPIRGLKRRPHLWYSCPERPAGPAIRKRVSLQTSYPLSELGSNNDILCCGAYVGCLCANTAPSMWRLIR